MGRVELARLFVSIGGLIVLALTAALVVPYFIDWSSYRTQFEHEAGRILGREVTVEGSARARLLPFPSVTFTDVSVAGDKAGVSAMTVDEFSMDAELAPFLRGEVLIFDMQLVRPVVTVNIGENGGIDWAVRPSSRFDPRQIRLENVSVKNGSILVHHADSGRTHTVTSVNAELSARTLAGPWNVDGQAEIDGTRTALSISTGRLGDDGRLRVRVDAEPDNYPFTLETDGDARFDDAGKALYAGDFRLQSRTAERDALRGSEGERFPVSDEDGDAEGATQTTAPPENRLHGSFSLDSERLSIDAFRFETGPLGDPYTANGKAFVTLGSEPRFSVTADGAQIRFGAPDAADKREIAGRSIDERFAALSAFMLKLPKPAIPGTVEVNLPAIVTGDTTIREIKLSAEPADKGWKIESVAATLPGRTRFEGAGLLGTADQLSFSGHLLMAVKQPSGFAAWLAKDVDESIRRLPAAGFSADVDLTRDHQAFENLEMVLGDARFHGSIVRDEPADAQPSMDVRLDGDKLDVEGMTAFASLFVSEEGTNRLANHDVDFEIEAGPVEAAGLTAKSVDTALRLREGTLEIDRLKIDGLAGASVSATGTINDFADEPTGKVDATVVSVDLAPLVSTLARRFSDNRLIAAFDRRARNYPGLLEDAEINVVASAADNGDRTTGMAISAQGKAGGTAFSFAASGKDLLKHPETTPFSVNFSGKNDEATALYALYGIPGIPLGLAGGAQTDFSADGNLRQGMDTTFSFSGDGLDARYDGTVKLEDEKPVLEGTARLSSEDIEPWLAAATVTLPGFGYGLPTKLNGDIEYSEGLLVVSRLNGDIAGSAVAGDLNAELIDGMPDITGSLNIEYLDMSTAAAMMLGQQAIEPSGDGRWPQKAFMQSANVPFNAEVTLGARTLHVGGHMRARDAQMALRLGDAGLHVANLKARLYGGHLEGLADLTNNGGTALLSAQLGLDDAALAKVMPADGLTGRVDLSASVTASGKSIEGMVAGLAGSGSAAARDVAITGLNPDAFTPILKRADAIGRDIDARDTASFAPAIVRNGTFDAGSPEVAFTLADGVVRAPPLRMDADGIVLSADTRFDLKTMHAHAEGSISYDPGEEEIDGSEPSVRFVVEGPVDDLQAKLETDPLAQYLTQRALEKEQARVEHMQAVLLEKQRLRRETQYYAALSQKRRQATEERKRFELETERARDRARKEAGEKARRHEQADEAAKRAKRGANGGIATEAPDEEDDSGAIERAPLPPPDQTSRTKEVAPKPDADAVSRFFAPDNLTVDGLLDLIGPRN